MTKRPYMYLFFHFFHTCINHFCKDKFWLLVIITKCSSFQCNMSHYLKGHVLRVCMLWLPMLMHHLP